MSLRNVFVLASATTLLAACGGDGTVAIELTDAPPDTATLSHVYVSLAAVEVHVAGSGDDGEKGKGDVPGAEDGGKWQTINERAGRFDLLALQNDVTASLGELDLPDGRITQIRLFIDESGDNSVITKDGQTCALDLKDVDKTGIKINHPFKAIDVPPGERVRIVVDFDLKESVDQAGACSFALKPVIKIKSSGVE